MHWVELLDKVLNDKKCDLTKKLKDFTRHTSNNGLINISAPFLHIEISRDLQLNKVKELLNKVKELLIKEDEKVVTSENYKIILLLLEEIIKFFLKYDDVFYPTKPPS